MYSNLNTTENISFIFVFLEGVFSFLSPCRIPLIPVFMSYLAGNTKNISSNGIVIYERKKTFLHTLCFSIGISFTFSLLGISFSALGNFLHEYQVIFRRIGGLIIASLGLFQLGVLKIKFLQKEKEFNLNLEEKEVNPFLAFILGFTFSFTWTPCVGPILSSVLILASGSKTPFMGNMLVLIYSLGFVIPFLILGLFTTTVLNFFNRNQKFINYTVKISGVLLVITGIMTFTGSMNSVTKYFDSFHHRGKDCHEHGHDHCHEFNCGEEIENSINN